MTEETILCAPREERIMVPYALMRDSLVRQREAFAAIAKHIADTDWPGEEIKFQDGAAFAAYLAFTTLF